MKAVDDFGQLVHPFDVQSMGIGPSSESLGTQSRALGTQVDKPFAINSVCHLLKIRIRRYVLSMSRRKPRGWPRPLRCVETGGHAHLRRVGVRCGSRRHCCAFVQVPNSGTRGDS